MSAESLKRFDGYLTEIKKKCSSPKNNITQEEYEKCLFYVEEAKKILQGAVDNSAPATPNSNHPQLIAKCCDITLIFTKYILSNIDETDKDARTKRLKNASILREGLLTFKENEKTSRELLHILMLLKKIYFDRFDNFLNKFIDKPDNEKRGELDEIRVKFYQSEDATECKAILENLSKEYVAFISNKKHKLEKIGSSYISIIDKRQKLNNYILLQRTKDKNNQTSQVGFFSKKSNESTPIPDGIGTPTAITSRVRSLIEKFNRM